MQHQLPTIPQYRGKIDPVTLQWVILVPWNQPVHVENVPRALAHPGRTRPVPTQIVKR